jgi:hypothetical protein
MGAPLVRRVTISSRFVNSIIINAHRPGPNQREIYMVLRTASEAGLMADGAQLKSLIPRVTGLVAAAARCYARGREIPRWRWADRG